MAQSPSILLYGDVWKNSIDKNLSILFIEMKCAERYNNLTKCDKMIAVYHVGEYNYFIRLK